MVAVMGGTPGGGGGLLGTTAGGGGLSGTTTGGGGCLGTVAGGGGGAVAGGGGAVSDSSTVIVWDAVAVLPVPSVTDHVSTTCSRQNIVWLVVHVRASTHWLKYSTKAYRLHVVGELMLKPIHSTTITVVTAGRVMTTANGSRATQVRPKQSLVDGGHTQLLWEHGQACLVGGGVGGQGRPQGNNETRHRGGDSRWPHHQGAIHIIRGSGLHRAHRGTQGISCSQSARQLNRCMLAGPPHTRFQPAAARVMPASLDYIVP
jgi:hypothetical protein